MTPKPVPQEPPNPAAMLSSLSDIINKLPAGAMEGMAELDLPDIQRRLRELETRTRLINLKLTLLLEKECIAWKDDVRVKELKG